MVCLMEGSDFISIMIEISETRLSVSLSVYFTYYRSNDKPVNLVSIYRKVKAGLLYR